MSANFMFRTDRSVSPTDAISAGTFIPFNSVLFCFSSDWDNNSPKDHTLTSYYRKYTDIISDTGTIIKEDGTPTKLKINPFIYSSNSEINWQSNTGILLAPNNDFKYFDNLFGGAEISLTSDTSTRYSGRHGYLSGAVSDAASTGRPYTDIPKILGRQPWEAVSSERYVIHDQPHAGHQHFVNGVDISKVVDQYPVGAGTILSSGAYDWKTLGLTLLPVVPIIRDPKIDGYSKKTNYLPKNVLVFGENLAADTSVNVVSRDPVSLVIPDNGDYTRSDYIHEVGITSVGDSASSENTQNYPNNNTYANTPLYLITTNKDMGVLNPLSNTLNVIVSSNTSGLHTHAGTRTDFKSTRTGQSGDILGPAGAHNHTVTYSSKVNLKSIWLNGWLTLKDQTPIANGIIIAFSPKNMVTHRGVTDHTDWLPPYWHFCDGSNGTPDLRGYNIAVNMYASQSNLHGTVINSSQNIQLSAITVNPNSGEVSAPTKYANGFVVDHKTHSHIIGNGPGKGTMVDLHGSHGVDPNRWHTHVPVNISTFTNPAGGTSTQLTTGAILNYLPARTNLAFIMYNSAIP